MCQLHLNKTGGKELDTSGSNIDSLFRFTVVIGEIWFFCPTERRVVFFVFFFFLMQCRIFLFFSFLDFFIFLFFGCSRQHVGILVPRSGMELVPPGSGSQVLTTGLPGIAHPYFNGRKLPVFPDLLISHAYMCSVPVRLKCGGDLLSLRTWK